METWGYCRPCARWFYCPKWFDKTAPQPLCPVCDSEPTAIESRDPAPQPVQVVHPDDATEASRAAEPYPRTEIRGLCPKCGTWFCCDDWFDQSVPLPCCPQCGLAPARLQYHWWSAGSGDDDALELDAGTSELAATSELWIG